MDLFRLILQCDDTQTSISAEYVKEREYGVVHTAPLIITTLLNIWNLYFAHRWNLRSTFSIYRFIVVYTIEQYPHCGVSDYKTFLAIKKSNHKIKKNPDTKNTHAVITDAICHSYLDFT